MNESDPANVAAVDIFGRGGDDLITGTSVAGVSDVLRGGDGADTFFGLAGDDFIIPGLGDDPVVVGGAGSDTFFPEPNGGDDVFSDFQPQDQIDGTLFGNELQAIEASRLGNGRTLVEFVGANTTAEISGVISPERLVAEANDLLVNFPAGVEVRVAGADAGAVIGENDVDEVEVVEEVVEEVEEVEEVEVVEEVNNNAGDAGDVIDGGDRRVVVGTDGNDVLNESDPANQLAVDINGLGGDDLITGTSVAGQSDILRGGDGADTFFGLAGDDFIIPGLGDDPVVVGGAGSDTFFPEPNGGDDVFSDFQPQDQIDGTLFGNELQAIEASRLGNGRTLVEFVGANTTAEINGVISPERLVAEANDLLVNFPAGIEVRVAGADAGVEIVDNGVVEEVEEVEEVEVVEEVEEVEVVNNNNGVVGDATTFFGGGQGTPAAVQQTVANGQGGLDVTGTDGRDPIAFGNTGDDNIRGFGGNDAIVGFNGNDFLDGGDGDDFVFGSQDDDIVLGGNGNDVVRGDNEAAGNGADIIVGGRGDDLLKGDGDNQIGADRFVFSAGDGNDIIQDFQVGVDTLDFTSFGDIDVDISQQGDNTLVSVGDVNVTLNNIDADDINNGDIEVGAGAAAVAEVVEEVEEIVEEVEVVEEVVEEVEVVEIVNNGGGGVVGDATAFFGGGQGAAVGVQSTVANGQGGLDVTGTDGNDPIAFGNTGDDNIRGFGGNDAIVGFNGNDFLDGGDGDDFVFGSQDDDIVLGGNGNDVVRGDNEAAGNGADIIVGGAGDDLLKGDGDNQVGADTFVFSAGDGNDIIQDFQVGVDTLDFSSFGGAAIDVSQQGSNALVSVGDVTVTLNGIDADDLSADDFDGGSLGA